MSEHAATIAWKRETESAGAYSRDHIVDFGHSTVVKFSAAKDFLGREELVDPEQAFTAALASCHLLTFLAIAAKMGFLVDSYDDEAVGQMGKTVQGKLAMVKVTLRPKVTFKGKVPTEEQFHTMHEKAHANCLIANSVITPVEVVPKLV